MTLLWLALCLAPDEGTDVAELLRVTGMSRPGPTTGALADHAKARPRQPKSASGAAGAPR